MLCRTSCHVSAMLAWSLPWSGSFVCTPLHLVMARTLTLVLLASAPREGAASMLQTDHRYGPASTLGGPGWKCFSIPDHLGFGPGGFSSHDSTFTRRRNGYQSSTGAITMIIPSTTIVPALNPWMSDPGNLIHHPQDGRGDAGAAGPRP